MLDLAKGEVSSQGIDIIAENTAAKLTLAELCLGGECMDGERDRCHKKVKIGVDCKR